MILLQTEAQWLEYIPTAAVRLDLPLVTVHPESSPAASLGSLRTTSIHECAWLSSGCKRDKALTVQTNCEFDR